MSTKDLYPIKNQNVTVKQKAIFAYLNKHRMKFTKFDGSLESILDSVKTPYTPQELVYVVGDLSMDDFTIFQFWTSILDMIVAIDGLIFTSCEKAFQLTKDLCFYQSFILHEDSLRSLIKLNINIPTYSESETIKKFKNRNSIDSITLEYVSLIESIYLGMLNLHSFNYLMDNALDEKEDLNYDFSIFLIRETEGIFLRILSVINKNSLYKNKEFSLMTIYEKKIEGLRGLTIEMLEIYAEVWNKHRLALPITIINDTVDLAEQKLIDGIYGK